MYVNNNAINVSYTDNKRITQGINNNDTLISRTQTMEMKMVKDDSNRRKSQQNVWGISKKTDKKDNNIFCIEWKFVDDNDESHDVILKHDQSDHNKKSRRCIFIDNVEKFKLKKSSQAKWKFELNEKYKKNGKKSVVVTVCIKYEPKNNQYS